MIITSEMSRSIACDQKDLWETPPHIFEQLDREFNFSLDPCCEEHTAKCTKFFTKEDNGLNKCWSGESVFVNPPYSRGNIDKWVKKCLEESKEAYPNLIVGLLPVSTSANWFHKYIVGHAELRFIKQRIRFVGAPYTAPFSSIIVIWGRSGIKSFDQ